MPETALDSRDGTHWSFPGRGGTGGVELLIRGLWVRFPRGPPLLTWGNAIWRFSGSHDLVVFFLDWARIGNGFGPNPGPVGVSGPSPEGVVAGGVRVGSCQPRGFGARRSSCRLVLCGAGRSGVVRGSAAPGRVAVGAAEGLRPGHGGGRGRRRLLIDRPCLGLDLLGRRGLVDLSADTPIGRRWHAGYAPTGAGRCRAGHRAGRAGIHRDGAARGRCRRPRPPGRRCGGGGRAAGAAGHPPEPSRPVWWGSPPAGSWTRTPRPRNG